MRHLSPAFVAGLLLTLSSASYAASDKAFSCGADTSFLSTWSSLLGQAKALDESAPLQLAQKQGFLETISMSVPNLDLLATTFTQDGRSYDLVAVKGSFLFNRDYPDAWGAVFESGQSQVVGILSSDTDRSIFRCKAIVDNKTSYIRLSAESFDNLLTAAKDGHVAYLGEGYNHFVSVTSGLAQAVDELGLAVIFVRSE